MTILSIATTSLLLCGFTAQRMSYPGPADALPYHKKVAALINKMPETIGRWESQNVPVPESALALLKHNAIISREYINTRTHQHLNLLIVQCRDARDMQGHYPPICYPSNGWTPESSQRMQWRLPGKTIQGMEYEYHQVFPMRVATIFVDNLILLPNGRMLHNINGVYQAAADYQTHFFGAAQFQIVFPADTTFEQRKRIATRFFTVAKPIIEAIGTGVHA